MHLLSWGIFKMAVTKKTYEKLNMGYFIPQLLIITDTQTVPLNICIWGCKILSNYSKIASWSSKGSVSKMAANFGPQIVLDTKSISVLFLIKL